MLAAKKKQIEIHNKLLFPNINKENSSNGQAQPKLRLADLSHNLASSYENNMSVGGGGLSSNHNNSDSVGSLRIMGEPPMGGVSNIRKPAPGQVGKAPNAPRKDNSPPGISQQMSQQQQHLLHQMYNQSSLNYGAIGTAGVAMPQ